MWKSSVCTKDCPDTCGLLVKVEQGKITRVKGDPDHPFTQGFICKKAGFFPGHVHNEGRILTPLKRSGPKGRGEFIPISWDQALDEIVDRIESVSKTHGSQAILPYLYAGHMGMIQRNAGRAFFHKLGASHLLPTICGPAATAGFKTTLGSGPSTDIESSVDSDLIIIWGSDTLTTNVHAWTFFTRARKKGAKIVVIDPVTTRTAVSADIHLAPRPGTDAALALGMIQVLVQEDLVDQDYLAAHTLGYHALVDRAKDYPLDRVEALSGVPAPAIRDLALAFGRARAPYIRTGWGPARQLRGAMAMRTIACLPALVGAFGKKGGGITRSVGGGPSDLSAFTRPDLAPSGTRTVNMVELGNALVDLDDPPIKLFYNFMSNPAAVAPQSAKVIRGLLREDLFVVVHELFMTDTALHADIILPGATSFEVTDIYRAYGHNYLQQVEPVIPPVGESRPNLAIFQALARRMGFTESVFQKDEAFWIKTFMADAQESLEGIDKKAFDRGKPVRLNVPANPYAKGFGTPSGKVEFFSKAWEDKGLDPLPCGRVWRDPEGGDTYPLELITSPHLLFLNSAFNEIPELRREAGPPRVMVHPEDAKIRGIKDGALVKVFNGRGESSLYAKVCEETLPGVLVAKGLHWPRYFPDGKGVNQLTSQRLTDQGETCAFHCNGVDIAPV